MGSGSHGSSNIFVSCSLLVHHQHQSQASSPAATKRTMARSPMKYHRCFVRQCRVIVQVIGETITAIKLASAEKWDQLWTDATTRCQCPFQALIIGLMDSEKKLDPVTVSSCIFLEDESAETTIESILAKVSGIVKGFARLERPA